MKKLIYAMLWIGLLSTPLQADGSAHYTTDNTDAGLTTTSLAYSVHALNPVKGETR